MGSGSTSFVGVRGQTSVNTVINRSVTCGSVMVTYLIMIFVNHRLLLQLPSIILSVI